MAAKKSGSESRGFTNEEREAMKDRARELKEGGMDGEGAVLSKLAAMTGSDRTIGQRLHALIRARAPSLAPRLWYGMPAYPNKDGKMICFFQGAYKFKTRYSTIGFSDKAKLDEGRMWPVYYALTELTEKEEEMIIALVKKAMGDE